MENEHKKRYKPTQHCDVFEILVSVIICDIFFEKYRSHLEERSAIRMICWTLSSIAEAQDDGQCEIALIECSNLKRELNTAMNLDMVPKNRKGLRVDYSILFKSTVFQDWASPIFISKVTLSCFTSFHSGSVLFYAIGRNR